MKSWQYCVDEKGQEMLMYIRVSNPEQYREVYALQEGKLISAFEEIQTDVITPENNTTWNCQYYIQDDYIVDLVSLGHGETETEEAEATDTGAEDGSEEAADPAGEEE